MTELDSAAYREALRRFASGVTVVTVAHGVGLHGMTASSFASISLEPPLVMVSLALSSRTLGFLSATERFAVNVLSEGQAGVAKAFAAPGDKSFEEFPCRPGGNGAPLLEGAIAWFECSVHQLVDAGDHRLVLGLVTDFGEGEGAPLVYYDRDYRRISDLR